MEIYKILGVGLIAVILIVYMKSVNSELTLLLTVSAGILILIMTVSYITDFIGWFGEIGSAAGVDSDLIKIIIKIIAVSYLIEFSVNLIEDFGIKSISDKVVLAGKILILTMAIPIIKNLLEIVSTLL